jgi:hypothetical protein
LKQSRYTSVLFTYFDMTVNLGSFSILTLKFNSEKMHAIGNGKARASGFAIPVLGRFPKVFLDVYCEHTAHSALEGTL